MSLTKVTECPLKKTVPKGSPTHQLDFGLITCPAHVDDIPLSFDELDHRTFPEAVVSGAAVPALALNSAPTRELQHSL